MMDKVIFSLSKKYDPIKHQRIWIMKSSNSWLRKIVLNKDFHKTMLYASLTTTNSFALPSNLYVLDAIWYFPIAECAVVCIVCHNTKMTWTTLQCFAASKSFATEIGNTKILCSICLKDNNVTYIWRQPVANISNAFQIATYNNILYISFISKCYMAFRNSLVYCCNTSILCSMYVIPFITNSKRIFLTTPSKNILNFLLLTQKLYASKGVYEKMNLCSGKCVSSANLAGALLYWIQINILIWRECCGNVDAWRKQ